MTASVGKSTTPPSADAVQQLAPRILESLAEMDRERRVPATLAQEMARAGLFRLGIPKRFGGAEADPATLVGTIEEIAAIDGSVGWCAMISSLYGVFGGCMPTEAARDIYGSDPNVITAGTFRPNGEATPVDGGYRVSGRWPFASHCQNATWLNGGARIIEGDQARVGPDGAPVWRLFFFPATDCLIVDTPRPRRCSHPRSDPAHRHCV